MSALGSISAEIRRLRHVRSASRNRLIADVAASQFRAKLRLMHCSKMSRYSITSSATASSDAGMATEKTTLVIERQPGRQNASDLMLLGQRKGVSARQVLEVRNV